ncbi:hypothetical protein FACS189473_0690 [Spirochaetia bacterium]|nr:hypothetical protein FACS189473_0690 [Spirochaetia bacterium]
MFMFDTGGKRNGARYQFRVTVSNLIEFDFDSSGKTAYFAVQIENEGKKGPWGPLVSELIP